MKPTLSVSTKPLKYHWHVFSSKAEIKRTEEGQRRELKQKKRDPGRVTDLCGECLLCCVHEAGSAFKEDQKGVGGYIVQLAIFVIFPSSANGIKDEG